MKHGSSAALDRTQHEREKIGIGRMDDINVGLEVHDLALSGGLRRITDFIGSCVLAQLVWSSCATAQHLAPHFLRSHENQYSEVVHVMDARSQRVCVLHALHLFCIHLIHAHHSRVLRLQRRLRTTLRTDIGVLHGPPLSVT